MSLYRGLSRALMFCILVNVAGLCSPTNDRLQMLMRDLESTEKSDQATRELLQLGKADSRSRVYLSEHLPAIIEKRPHEEGPWNNAVRLAGDLRIAEASRSLARWIDFEGGPLHGTTGLSLALRLEDKPAAKALAQIGDPAIPDVASVLAGEDLSKRRAAAYVLYNIGSPSAKKALKERLSHETDPSLHTFIRKALDTG